MKKKSVLESLMRRIQPKQIHALYTHIEPVQISAPGGMYLHKAATFPELFTLPYTWQDEKEPAMGLVEIARIPTFHFINESEKFEPTLGEVYLQLIDQFGENTDHIAAVTTIPNIEYYPNAIYRDLSAHVGTTIIYGIEGLIRPPS